MKRSYDLRVLLHEYRGEAFSVPPALPAPDCLPLPFFPVPQALLEFSLITITAHSDKAFELSPEELMDGDLQDQKCVALPVKAHGHLCYC